MPVPTIPLPDHSTRATLDEQAELVRDLVVAGDAGALAMVDEFHPDLAAAPHDPPNEFALADAQLVIAGLYNFVDWGQLREHVALVEEFTFVPPSDRDGWVESNESFVALACVAYAARVGVPAERITLAHQVLTEDPSVATGSIEALATVGDHVALGEMLDAQPELVNAECGPNAWPPLLYATFSRLETDNTDWSAVETVRTLLGHGADPNAGWLWHGLVPPFTAVTATFGNGEKDQSKHPDRLAIARLLLEAGADPNDGQTLYNNGIGGTNHDDPAHLELLFEFGLGTDTGGPWFQRFGRHLRPPAESLYDELEAAVWRGRPHTLQLLITKGLELDRPVGRSQKTLVRLAAQQGHHDILDILAGAGLDATMTPVEQFLDSVRTSDAARLSALVGVEPALAAQVLLEHPHLIKHVDGDDRSMLNALLTLGFDINLASGGSGTTALHDAAQENDLDRVKMLLAHGADPQVLDTSVGLTPWHWAQHFSAQDTAAFLDPLTTRD